MMLAMSIGSQNLFYLPQLKFTLCVFEISNGFTILDDVWSDSNVKWNVARQ